MPGRAPTADEVKARFVTKYLVDEKTQCWLWQKTLNNKGYGEHGVLGERLAHRVSYRIHVGDIPSGMCVLHRCDTPACVNPEHLFLGTMKDNSQDMTRKQRHGAATHPEKVPRGANHPNFGGKYSPRGSEVKTSKLKEDQVRDIKRRVARGERDADVARLYDVSAVMIRYIRIGRSWAHIKC